MELPKCYVPPSDCAAPFCPTRLTGAVPCMQTETLRPVRTVPCKLSEGASKTFRALPLVQNMECASPLPFSIPPSKIAFYNLLRQRGCETSQNAIFLTPSRAFFFLNREIASLLTLSIPPPKTGLLKPLAQLSRISLKCASPLPFLSPPRIVCMLQYLNSGRSPFLHRLSYITELRRRLAEVYRG